MRTHKHTIPGLWRSWRRATARAVVIGTITAGIVASAVSAEPPYEPTDTYTHLGGGEGYWTPTDPNDDPTTTTYPTPDEIGGAVVPNSGATTDPTGCGWNEDLETDLVKITDDGIDFGDSSWVGVFNDPIGPGSVQWAVDCGFYTARVVGTLHLDDVAGQYGRIHVSFWSYDDHIETRHSLTRRSPDKGHDQWAVNLSPSTDDIHITEVHVCTEISDDGVNFELVSCKRRYLG